jgi:hypothetical protein
MAGRNPRADTDPSRKNARALLLDRRLLAYAAAAGAAIAGAQTAQAAVQSRTLDVTVFNSATGFKLDVDQDGIDDFRFQQFSVSSGTNTIAFVYPEDEDTGWLTGTANQHLHPGQGPGDVKLVDAKVETASTNSPHTYNYGEYGLLAATPGGGFASDYGTGNWAGQSGFLGLQFESSTTDNSHFGFVQLSVDANDSATPLAIRMTGVAWEDQAQEQIHIENINIAIVVPEPVSLGLLAMGAVGIAAMRRRQSA